MMGDGGILQSRRLRGDLSLVGLAVRKRWPVSEEMKRELLERIGQIIENGSTEDSLRAVKLVLDMEGQNQRDDLRQVPKLDRADWDRISEDLGVSQL